MVDSDSFIISSLCNWDFGADNTGNIMSSHNIRAFRARVLQGGLADIVTGDGGIGCDENPEEQERLTARLVMCEVIAVIGVLKPGGCMIIKMFTTFTAGSLACVAFIASLFRRCYMLKPATSKSSNSEIYVVACDFTGLPSELWYRISSASTLQNCNNELQVHQPARHPHRPRHRRPLPPVPLPHHPCLVRPVPVSQPLLRSAHYI